jgi:hypothetical protein
MNEARAVPLDQLRLASAQGPYPAPLCPRCISGRLWPYSVSFTVGIATPYYGADYLTGWVAVCVGNEGYLRENGMGIDEKVPPCGFSMNLTPGLFPGRNNK